MQFYIVVSFFGFGFQVSGFRFQFFFGGDTEGFWDLGCRGLLSRRRAAEEERRGEKGGSHLKSNNPTLKGGEIQDVLILC